MVESVIAYLERRGFVDALTSEEIRSRVEQPTRVYAGFDPTADSLHLGNLIGIMALAHFQRFGHTPVIVLGGATGRIGDPSGKSVERPLLDSEAISRNVDAIRAHFEQVLDFSGALPTPLVVNNDQWYSRLGVVDFLRDVGKHFRLGSMLAKEMVRSRFESEEGISYTEFSYQILQAYDFYHLYTQHQVSIQLGGSDQWGNITAGIEFTRKMTRESVYGLTWPLLTRSDGKKFGKTAEGAVWLAAEKCSPYQLYQHLYGVADADVIHMMKMLTFMELDEIAAIEKGMRHTDYQPNSAQRRLAEEVTRILHGDAGVATARRVTEGAAPGRAAKLDGATLREIAAEMPSANLSREDALGKRYADLAVVTGLLSSKGEANRLIKNGGAYLNNEPVTDPSYAVGEEDLVDGCFLLLGAGKKKKLLISLK